MLQERYCEFHPGVDDAGKRLDRVLRRMLPDIRLGEIFAIIRTGKVRINGRKVKGQHRLSASDVLQLERSLTPEVSATAKASQNPAKSASSGMYRPLNDGQIARSGTRSESPHRTGDDTRSLADCIIFENEHLLCINKPRGITVHGPSSVHSWVKRYLSGRVQPSLSFRVGPLHRIDRNTTGVVFFSKSAIGARRFTSLMRRGVPRKVYLAVLNGSLRSPQVWEDMLVRDREAQRTEIADAGSRAITAVYPVLWTEHHTLALCTIQTGRTHQIRAQASYHGHPLVGDGKYSGGPGSYALHALAFILPERDEELGFLHVYASPADSVVKTVDRLFGSIPEELLLQSLETAASLI